MRRFLSMTITVALLALSGSAYAGQIWTDGNGDGLPDSGPLPATPSTNVTIGVWIDAQSFNWTNYLTYVEWTANCFSYISASYVITGGSNFPIDNFSHPRAIGFGGSGFNEGGVDHIGNYVLHLNLPTSCCVSPIIDIYNPYYVFSQLGAGSSYMLFTSNPGTCYGEAPQPRGSCCLPDFSCIPNLTEAECAAAGGVQWNQDQDCSQCMGEPTFEACCFPDGSCVDSPVGTCPPGSQPQGPGTDCGQVNCPQPPLGACCLPQFCVITTEADCAARGGVYRGDGTNCDPPGCESNAVEPRSWGKIKGLFR